MSRQMKHITRTVLSEAAHNPLNAMYEGVGTIVLYHRITTAKGVSQWLSPYSGLVVSEEEFEKQIEYFSNNFECIPLDEILDRLRTEPKGSKRLLSITFDDGFRDNLELGLGVLEKHEVPATIYVTTGLIDQTMTLWWEEIQFLINKLAEIEVRWGPKAGLFPLSTPKEKNCACEYLSNLAKDLPPSGQAVLLDSLRQQCGEKFSYDGSPLSWDQVRKLDSHPLITIGAHTVSHSSLKRLMHDELVREIRGSKEKLEQELGHAVHHFSFPYGCRNHVSSREIQAVEIAGFRSSVTTLFGHLFREHLKHPFALPRVGIDLKDTLPYLRWKLTGSAACFRNHGQRIVTIG